MITSESTVKPRNIPPYVLTDEQIEEMGQLYKGGTSYAECAKKYGVMISTATKHIKRWNLKQALNKQKLDATPLQANPASQPTSSPRSPSKFPSRAQPPFQPPNPPIGQPTEDFDPLKTQLVLNPIVSDGKEQSYRDDLLWAIDAAGNKLRTGNRPNSCPNDKAFFLYQLACENPKDFMTKFSQVETKEKEDTDTRQARKSTEFMLEEINRQLEALEQ